MGRTHLAAFGSVLVASGSLLGCSADTERIGPASQASHAWGNYHWARTGDPFTLKLGNNVSAVWGPILTTASADWSQSDVLDTVIVGGGTRARTCKPTLGRVEVCSARYGLTGWLGVAQIWALGNHITQATVKVNDSYHDSPPYNTTAWRNLVMCQEVGHAFGLHHQDENPDDAPLGTCMDYSNDPVPNQHPNAHDYEQLEIIYGHLDGSTTVGALPSFADNAEFGSPEQWGELRGGSPSGRAETYVRAFEGFELITHVIKAE